MALPQVSIRPCGGCRSSFAASVSRPLEIQSLPRLVGVDGQMMFLRFRKPPILKCGLSLAAAMVVATLALAPTTTSAAAPRIHWRIGTYTEYAPAITSGSFGSIVLLPGGSGGPASVTWSGRDTLTIVTNASSEAGEIHTVAIAPRTPTGLGSQERPGTITVSINGTVLWDNSPWWAVRTGGIREMT